MASLNIKISPMNQSINFFTFLILFAFAVSSCTSTNQESKKRSPNLPSFPKEKMEWQFKRVANEDGKVPRNGQIKAYRELVANGKIIPGEKQSNKNDELGWKSIDNFFPSLSVTQLTHDPNNTDVFYFSTGEGWFGAGMVRGAGVWKSTDAGETWFQLESTMDNEIYDWCQDIVVHPQTSDVYLATRDDGLHRSSDGGETWEKVLGNGVGSLVNSICDIELTADGGIFATTGIFEIGRIFYSDSGDAGTFEAQTNGFITSGVNRIEIATAPSNADVAYAIPTDASDYRIAGIFKTTDRGETWEEINNPNNDYELAKFQGWYDLMLEVDPNDEDVVIAGGWNVWRSRNGGEDWQQLSFGKIDSIGYQYIHVDQHKAVFLNSDTVYITNDGGIWQTHEFSSDQPIFRHRNYTYNVTQFYAGAIFQEADDFRIFGGTQDNGTYISTDDGYSNFELLTWLDGAFCDQHPVEENILFTSSQLNRMYRVDFDSGEIDSLNNPYLTDDDVLFINPMHINPYNPNHLYMASTKGVWRLDNPTVQDSTHWTQACLGGIGDISALGFSESEPNTIYVGRERFAAGSQPARLYRLDHADTSTVATSLVNIDPNNNLPTASNFTTSSIAVDPNNADHIIVTYSNYGLESVWETENASAEDPVWTNVEGNLPDFPVFWAEFHPNNTDKVYLGTELGVFFTNDLNGADTDWNPTNDGLANVPVYMLRIRASDNTMLAASYGRGLFTATLDPTAEQMALTWEERGPKNVGGRTRALMVDPNDPTERKFWTGGVSGGLWYTNNIDSLGDDILVNVEEPQFFNAIQWNVFPNPTLGSNASVNIELDKNVAITVQVYDMNGQLMQSVYSGEMNAGKQTFEIDNSNWPKGVYQVQLITDGNKRAVKKLVVN